MILKQHLKLFGALCFAGFFAPAFGQATTPVGTYQPLSTIPGVVNAATPIPPELQIVAPLTPPDEKKFVDADLWQRVRRGFVMGELNSPFVLQQEQWYATRPDYIQRFVDRGSKYLHHIVEEVEKRGMPTEVALLPIIESAFNPQAFSSAKASGMWQFMPSTGKHFGLKQDTMADHRRDVVLSTGAALDYLQKLYRMFNSWELAFAAYNCGEGCVGRAIARNQKLGLPTDYLSLTLPAETRNYVPKLIAVKNIVLSPGSYGIELEAVENRPYFAKVAAPEKIDTKLAARLAEMPENEFATLNPAFTRPVATSGTGYFLVPFDKAETFRANLELYRSLNGPLVSWQSVNVKRGESIDAIARRYGVTGSYLRATNGALNEKKGKLQVAATIMVPMSGRAKAISAMLDKKVSLAVVQAVAAVDADRIAPTPATVSAPSAHRVRRGETLFSIARQHGVASDEIKLLNAMKNNRVRLGQSLLLSENASAAMTPSHAPTLARASAPAKKIARKRPIYTVRSGDTLYAIANKFDVEIDDLLRWNKLGRKSVLQPGNRIRVTL